MTTRVLIVNHGPAAIDVHLHPPLAESDARHAAGSVPPHNSREYWVHEHQEVILTERKETA